MSPPYSDSDEESDRVETSSTRRKRSTDRKHSDRRKGVKRKSSWKDCKERDLPCSLTQAARIIVRSGTLSEDWIKRETALVPESPCPPFEAFSKMNHDVCLENFNSSTQAGDRIYAKVEKCDAAGAYMQPLCYVTNKKRILDILNINLCVLLNATAPRVIQGGIYVIECTNPNPMRFRLVEGQGKLTEKDLPLYFREARILNKKSFRDYVEDSKFLQNRYLPAVLQLPESSLHTFLPINPKQTKSDRDQPAEVLRKEQDLSMANDEVAKGVAKIKEGDPQRAHVYLNKALEIYPDCVDALVARGAALTNFGEYAKAEEDLKKAHEIDPLHPNATNYYCETLMAYAKTFEVKGELTTALEKFEIVVRLRKDRRAIQAVHRIKAALKSKNPGASQKNGRTSYYDPLHITFPPPPIPEPSPKKNDDKPKTMSVEDKKRLSDIEKLISDLKRKKK